MRNLKYNKECNVSTLTLELDKAGYAIHGCSNSGNETIVHCKDEETKDPTPIVLAHVYTPPAPPKDFKDLFKKATTAEQKIDLIAEQAGLK